jgi:hypothetical protein
LKRAEQSERELSGGVERRSILTNTQGKMVSNGKRHFPVRMCWE